MKSFGICSLESDDMKKDKCAYCGNVENLEIHHIKPRQMGLDNSPSNLIVLCRECHRKIPISKRTNNDRKRITLDVPFEDKELRDLWKKFDIADFERKVYRVHVKNIKEAILEGKLLDRRISVWEDGIEGKYYVIDGQHRIGALSDLFAENKLKSFDLLLQIIKAKGKSEAREIYINLNRGKELTASEILKVYDDGNNPFFIKLNQLCSHYRTRPMLSFYAVLVAYRYANGKSIKVDFIDRKEIGEVVGKIEAWEIERLAQFVSSLYNNIGRNTDLFMYKAVILRNLCRIYWEQFNKPNPRRWVTFLKNIALDKHLMNVSSERCAESYKSVYNYIIDRCLK